MNCGERGAATVLALPLLGVLTVAAVLLAHLGGALVASRRVAAAADLAALAAASALQRGGDACDTARSVLTLNRVELADCRVDGEDVLVSARLDYRGVVGHEVRVGARARAGPSAPG